MYTSLISPSCSKTIRVGDGSDCEATASRSAVTYANNLKCIKIILIDYLCILIQARRKQNESGEAQKVAREACRRKWAW